MQKYINMEIDERQAALWGEDAGRAVDETIIRKDGGSKLTLEDLMLNELEKMDENRRRKIRELRRNTKKSWFGFGKKFWLFKNPWCCGRD